MGDGEGFIAGLGGLIFIGFLIYAIVYIIVVIAISSVILAMIAIGLLSFVMSKSGKALVNQPNAFVAGWSAISWSGTLCVGCVIGSIGLLLAISALTEGSYATDVFERHATGTDSVERFSSFFLNWVGYDAFSFYINVALVLYLANRIYIAKSLGGTHWLSIIPPIGAIVIFFVSKHFEEILSVLLSGKFEQLNVFLFALIEEMIFPFRLCYLGITQPDQAWEWARQTLWQSDGSFFQLASLMPSIFVVIAAILVGRNLFSTNGSPEIA